MRSAQQVRGGRIEIRAKTASSVTLTIIFLLFAPTQSHTQTLTVLYAFKGVPDGAAPNEALVQDTEGNLYGTTRDGGSHQCGTVFKIDKRGRETVLYSFACMLDGYYPEGGLVRDADGNLYGTTYGGGNPECHSSTGCGTVFELDKKGEHTVLYRFHPMPDGNSPYYVTLSLDGAGNIYGTTVIGGDNNCNPGWGCGTVFKLDKSGKETILHTFHGIEKRDGGYPYSGLVSDPSGYLYGTTYLGGAPCYVGYGYQGCGTVFKIDQSGNETILHRFGGVSDFGNPTAGLIRDSAGNLYGTALGGNGFGKVFRLNSSRQETDLLNLAYDSGYPGAGAELLRDVQGNLYGTTSEGGTYYHGIVFKLTKEGQMTVLHNFTGGADGGIPESTLIMDDAGNLYGTTLSGGTGSCDGGDGCGVVFKITP